MDERELGPVERSVRTSLATLDRLAVPSLAAVRSGRAEPRGARAARAWARTGAALAAGALVLVIAVAVGGRLGAWRAERSGAEPSRGVASSSAALDEAYGLLAASDDTGRTPALIDERGRPMGPTFSGVAGVRTSPNGRYVALALETSSGLEIRVLDGVTRTVGPPLLQGGTSYVLAANDSFAWSTDSSGLVIALKLRSEASRQVTRALVWIAELGNVARQIAMYDGADVRPTLWQRPAGLIALSATRTVTDASPHYVQMREDGALLRDDPVASVPVAADGTGRYVASYDGCQPAPCTKIVVRSATTYAEVASIAVPSDTNMSWFGFVPRSSDLLVQSARYTADRRVVGTLWLHPDQGRGQRRELASIDTAADASAASPWVLIRADGSAALYGLALRDGSVQGELVTIPRGERSPVRIARSLAAVVLDPSREMAAPAATAAPSASPSPATRVLTDAQAWALIRSALPANAPVAPPTWLPASIDRDRVEVSVVGDPADPRFTITYRSPQGTITYALGPTTDVAGGSGYGTRVRGVPATLTFDQSLWTDRTKPALRRVRWEERRPGLSVAGTTLSISSETFSGDDLLHIAWSLDRAGSALANIPRPAPGTCAAADPVETVRKLLALLGSRNAAAVSDCFAEGGQGWETLPPIRIDDARQVENVGGRPTVIASWTFSSDPGGAWGPRPTRFFQLGLEDGVWRIYEVGSAPIGPPP